MSKDSSRFARSSSAEVSTAWSASTLGSAGVRRGLSFWLAAWLGLGSLAGRADWPEFRGPTGDGHAPAEAAGLPLHWSETENVRWKTEIPHRGWSTPVVLGGQVWLTTATGRRP
jgi:hypothetical protein